MRSLLTPSASSGRIESATLSGRSVWSGQGDIDIEAVAPQRAVEGKREVPRIKVRTLRLHLGIPHTDIIEYQRRSYRSTAWRTQRWAPVPIGEPTRVEDGSVQRCLPVCHLSVTFARSYGI